MVIVWLKRCISINYLKTVKKIVICITRKNNGFLKLTINHIAKTIFLGVLYLKVLEMFPTISESDEKISNV